MHFHVGFFDLIKFICYLLVAGLVLRALEAYTANTKFGQALSFIY